MASRILGALLVLLGTAAVLAAGYGLLRTGEIATSLSLANKTRGVAFDASTWSRHWQVSGAFYFAVGVALCVSGAAVMLRRSWAFLLLATVALSNIAFRWLLARLAASPYAFETTSVAEYLTSAGIVCAALLAYWASRHRGGG